MPKAAVYPKHQTRLWSHVPLLEPLFLRIGPPVSVLRAGGSAESKGGGICIGLMSFANVISDHPGPGAPISTLHPRRVDAHGP